MKKTAILLFVLLIMSCGCTNISGGVTSVPETTPAVAETEGTEEAVEAVIYIDEDAIESSEKRSNQNRKSLPNLHLLTSSAPATILYIRRYTA